MDTISELLRKLQTNDIPLQTLAEQIAEAMYTTGLSQKEIESHLRTFIFLTKSKNPNSSDENGYALILSIILGLDSYTKRFIKEGRNLDFQCKSGGTALMRACHMNNEKIVKTLIKNKCNLDLQDKYGMTALFQSCMCNNQVVVDLLIKAGCNMSLQTNSGENALMIACTLGRVESVRILVEYGCDLNDGGETSPLICALIQHKYDCAMLLIKGGCDIDTLNSQKSRNFCANSRKDVTGIFDVMCYNDNPVSFECNIGKMVELLNEGIWIRVRPILYAWELDKESLWKRLPREVLDIILEYSLLKFYKTK